MDTHILEVINPLLWSVALYLTVDLTGIPELGAKCQEPLRGSKHTDRDCCVCPQRRILRIGPWLVGVLDATLHCQSRSVVYMIRCQCGRVYIGETKRPAAVRWRKHKKEICKACEHPDKQVIPFYEHMRHEGCSVEQLQFNVLAQVHGDRNRMEAEQAFIEALGTRQICSEWGLNGPAPPEELQILRRADLAKDALCLEDAKLDVEAMEVDLNE